MLDDLIRSLVIVPFFGVPIALVAWTIFQFAVRGAPVRALIGLIVGAALCVIAFLFFFSNIYCENCSGRPVSPHEAVAIIVYFAFGLAMFLVLWWTARASKRRDPDQGGNDKDEPPR
jgi:hypothetical protein